MALVQAAAGCLVAAVGLYLLCRRPVTGRYGGRGNRVDLVMGLLLLAAGAGLAWLSGVFGG